jgi:predicted dehydrogenase
MIIDAIGRRLRLGVAGGGLDSVIGQVHRAAASLDGYYDIVASALSSNSGRSRQSGRTIGISEQRSYASWQELILEESRRDDGIDIIAVMTPNDSHFEICSAALDAGFHVICDKPLTTNLTSAVSLARKVRSTGLEFCLTHSYTGYP